MIIYPKINLFLEITARRADGFHEIATVMQTVSNVADTLEAAAGEELSLAITDLRSPVPVPPGGGFSVAGTPLPADERNLVIKAARALREKMNVRRGARFVLTKRIPDGAGLGGGSADAAAALVLLNRLWELNLTREELAETAGRIGSDVAFFIFGGTALCTGRGEKITPLAETPRPVTLIVPPWKSATAAAYQALNPADFARHPVEPFLRLLQNTPPGGNLALRGFNIFEAALSAREPRQAELMAFFAARGVAIRLSGSGSCLWTDALSSASRDALQTALAAVPNLAGTRLL